MGSTLGGFLIGVGMMVLLLSFGGMYAVLNLYAPAYNELLTYKDSILELYDLMHSPQLEEMLRAYQELARLAPQLDMAVENYAKAYPRIMEHKHDVELFYSITHSSEYGDVVGALWQLSSYMNQIVRALELIGLGWLAGPLRMIPTAASYMDEAKDWSGMAKNAMETLEMFPPGRVSAYANQLKTLLTLLPPEKLGSYLSQARVASERAVEIVETVERYPPQTVFVYTVVGWAMGLALSIAGSALTLRARRGEKERCGEPSSTLQGATRTRVHG
jgi:hypothetical protein